MASSGRQTQQEEGNNDKNHQVPGKDYSKRRHGSLKQSAGAIRNMISAQRMNHLGLYLEPLVRRVLREELPPILQRHRHLFQCCEATLNQTGPSGCRALHLRFTNKLPATVFTHTKITSEDGAPLGIALCTSQNCIVKDGPLACTRIMVCALNGEFGSDGSEDWSAEEFDANISPQRQHKGPLLNGDTLVRLENGVGLITNIEFSDNSSWTRSRRFRLGAKVLQNEANVREARSEAFVVKDRRGELYKKHDRPSLDDEIWRLKKIAKDGRIHKDLSSHQVKTVKDLLQLYVTNPSSLQQKMHNIAKKSRETIIEHAKACDIDDGKHYIYHYPTAERPMISLLFNSIYKLEEVSFGGHNYRSLESLNSEEKLVAESAKQNAYENLNDLIPVETSTYGLGKTLACLQQFDFSSPQQGQASTSKSLVGVALQNGHVGTDQTLLKSSGEEFISQIQFANCLSPPASWGLENPFDFPSGYGAEFSDHSCLPYSAAMVISGRGNGKTVWNKIRNALKVVIPFVAKRKAKLSIPSN